jgi:hypothetical protein
VAWQLILRIATYYHNRIDSGPPLTRGELLQIIKWIAASSNELDKDRDLALDRLRRGNEETKPDFLAVVLAILGWGGCVGDYYYHNHELSPFGWAGLALGVMSTILAVWCYDRHREIRRDAQYDLDGIDYASDRLSELKQRLIPLLYAG